MKDKDDSPSSVLALSRYVRKPATAPDTEDNEPANAFQEARARSREALMLDVVFADGTIESFDYSLPKRVTYKPDGTLILRFGQDTITAKGSNLQRVRQAVTEGRAKAIQEGTEAEQGLKPEDAAHIERIEIVEAQEGP
jgi:hypothetical protein